MLRLFIMVVCDGQNSLWGVSFFFLYGGPSTFTWWDISLTGIFVCFVFLIAVSISLLLINLFEIFIFWFYFGRSYMFRRNYSFSFRFSNLVDCIIFLRFVIVTFWITSEYVVKASFHFSFLKLSLFFFWLAWPRVNKS